MVPLPSFCSSAPVHRPAPSRAHTKHTCCRGGREAPLGTRERCWWAVLGELVLEGGCLEAPRPLSSGTGQQGCRVVLSTCVVTQVGLERPLVAARKLSPKARAGPLGSFNLIYADALR